MADGGYDLSVSRRPLPFLKWAGGKRWFVQRYPHLLPLAYKNYIEPFVGSGAVFFHLAPKNAVLSDANRELIELYSAIKSDHRAVELALRRHARSHCDDYYYLVRSSRPRTLHGRAARFLYLNRTCWNGLYRVNRHGEFNVPRGTKNAVLLDTDAFDVWSQVLSGAKLLCGDFEKVIDRAGAEDFVFVDPPYTVSHNNNGFLKYNQKIFSWADQQRLRDALVRLHGRGGHFAVTNAMHESVCQLYRGFNQFELARASVISGKNAGRRCTSELFVANY